MWSRLHQVSTSRCLGEPGGEEWTTGELLFLWWTRRWARLWGNSCSRYRNSDSYCLLNAVIFLNANASHWSNLCKQLQWDVFFSLQALLKWFSSAILWLIRLFGSLSKVWQYAAMRKPEAPGLASLIWHINRCYKFAAVYHLNEVALM